MKEIAIGAGVVLVLGLGIGTCAYGIPLYRVYSARADGEAKRAEAEGSRHVLVTQAKAEKEAAIERAEAIRIVGEAAQKYPEYRQQEFIGAFGEALREGNIQQIVYVPTEANIPILEVKR